MSRKRKLICVPIVHAEADMGSVLPLVKGEYLRRGGPPAWKARLRSVDAMWRRIRRSVLALELEYPRVKIYQDGLPVCGWEEEIVREVAGRGSPNHQLILDLMGKGAQLVGTESSELLLKEYHQLERLARMRDAAERRDIEACRRRLLMKRDEFIARRIDETLGEGETGILFIGLLHDVFRRIPADIDASLLGEP